MSGWRELEKYYRIVQPKDILSGYEIGNILGNKQVNVDKELLARIIDIIIDTNDSGSYSIDNVVKLMSDLGGKDTNNVKALAEFIQIFVADNNNNTTPPLVNKVKFLNNDINKTKISAITVASPRISQSVKDINKTSLFFNSIPSIEMARCVPYLDVKFQFQQPQFGPDGRLLSPSLLKFLNGNISNFSVINNSNTPDAVMLNGMQTQQYNYKAERVPVQVTGMELFTTPQTLINPNDDASTSKRLTPVIDKFRPFMSIESLEINVAPSVGFFTYKTARLNLVLHDRSRLSEIGDLVRPQVYTRTIVSLTYGWSHPDHLTGDNAYGDLLNRMVVKDEKYGIVNASFSFDTVGQVKIALQLATKGTYELQILKMSDSDKFANAQRVVEQLIEAVSELRANVGLRKSDALCSEIRPYQTLDAIERGDVINLFNDDAFKKDFIKLRQSLLIAQNDPRKKIKPDVKNLTQKLDELFGKSGNDTNAAVGQLKQALDKAVKDKMDKLKNVDNGDPFLNLNDNSSGLAKLKTDKKENKNQGTINEQFITLGKLMLIFIGEPYQSAGIVNEVQFIFYPFNDYAGLAGATNIASFPILFKDLDRVLKEHVKEKRSNNLTVHEFMLLVQNALVSDVRSHAYGLRNIYTLDKENKVIVNPNIKEENIPTELSKVQKYGGTFKQPVLEAHIETLGGRPYGPGEITTETGRSIMRIHIYDKQSTPYAPFVQLLKTQNNLQDITTENKIREADLQQLQTLAQQAGITIKRDNEFPGSISANGNFQQVKDFVSRVIPTITYGSNCSNISNATLSSQQIPLLSTVQMLNAGKPGQDETNNLGIGGIPMRIIPTQLEMTAMGCPTLQVFQQFFIDFFTGTTADNIYVLNSLTHTISPGKFQSSMKLTFVDSYGVYESLPSKLKIINKKLKEAAGIKT
jgi:hypothetical protein